MGLQRRDILDLEHAFLSPSDGPAGARAGAASGELLAYRPALDHTGLSAGEPLPHPSGDRDVMEPPDHAPLSPPPLRPFRPRRAGGPARGVAAPAPGEVALIPLFTLTAVRAARRGLRREPGMDDGRIPAMGRRRAE
jgi:hypothetical protein